MLQDAKAGAMLPIPSSVMDRIPSYCSSLQCLAQCNGAGSEAACHGGGVYQCIIQRSKQCQLSARQTVNFQMAPRPQGRAARHDVSIGGPKAGRNCLSRTPPRIAALPYLDKTWNLEWPTKVMPGALCSPTPIINCNPNKLYPTANAMPLLVKLEKGKTRPCLHS